MTSDTAAADCGFIRIASRHSVNEALDRLESLLRERGIMVFCRIDFSGDAERARLELRAEQLLIFGNPKAGTPLLAREPTVGLDLPLKALAWQDVSGQTWIAYNVPSYITQRHRLPGAMDANLAAVVPLIHQAAAD
jgi:uncharacterized protein (DUF302 family)